jgi:hypothetical protein
VVPDHAPGKIPQRRAPGMAGTVHFAVGDVDRCELRELFHSARHVVKLWHLFFTDLFPTDISTPITFTPR